jgi:hypothetical protein
VRLAQQMALLQKMGGSEMDDLQLRQLQDMQIIDQ